MYKITIVWCLADNALAVILPSFFLPLFDFILGGIGNLAPTYCWPSVYIMQSFSFSLKKKKKSFPSCFCAQFIFFDLLHDHDNLLNLHGRECYVWSPETWRINIVAKEPKSLAPGLFCLMAQLKWPFGKSTNSYYRQSTTKFGMRRGKRGRGIQFYLEC